jgi:hypothetical protein
LISDLHSHLKSKSAIINLTSAFNPESGITTERASQGYVPHTMHVENIVSLVRI